jgi:GH15 family glucan-1,4-alpha-glucosidase
LLLAGIAGKQTTHGAPMPSRIEDYAVIGNCESLALVGRDGSIDWMCLPRFDSGACFAALLGGPENGRWLIAPSKDGATVSRRYRGDTLILETEFATETGIGVVIDFMMCRDGVSDVVRLVRGIKGTVEMRTELIVRFDYGSIVPWVMRDSKGQLQLTAGPDRLLLVTPVHLHGENMKTVGKFTVREGEEIPFCLNWSASWQPQPEPADGATGLRLSEEFWSEWVARMRPMGEWSPVMMRSLLTLKGLSHRETGGIVAAGTTSLPEWIGAPRNWDYRFCWLRDATLTLFALMGGGCLGEAQSWRDWLIRAAAGGPNDLQIMYGVAGDRRLTEFEIPWLPGYENSAPVRIGNAASGQIQLDVYGEVLLALYVARKAGLQPDEADWALEVALVNHLEKIWEEPDDGIWEVRGGRQHFVHSKVMAWVAFDSAIKSAREFGLEAPIERWRKVRAKIHAQVCERGFDKERNSFVQAYGSKALDAALLIIPKVRFLPASDPRVKGTLAAIEKGLVRDGFVLRYDTGVTEDGLPPGEGAFLACSFWLVDNYVLQHRYDEALELFERLLSLRNDVGLLAEEYDPRAKRMLGNFPQAFSHLALINSARNLMMTHGKVHPPGESPHDLHPAAGGVR